MAADETLPTRDVDVLIIGAGPIGLLLGNLLGEAGVDALIIEREADLTGVPRAVALDDEGMRTLQAAGLLEAVAPKMLMGYDHHLLGRRGQLLLRVNPADQDYGFPKRNRFHQPELEHEMLLGVRRRHSVGIRFGVNLKGLAIDEEGVTAEVAAASGPERVRARYVVGCDGGNSLVRRLCDIYMSGESHPEPWIVIDTENNPDDARFSRAVGDPRRPNVNVPGMAGRRRYEFMLLPGEDPKAAASMDAVHRLLEPWCDLDRVKVTRHAVYTFHSLLAERFSAGGRVFLAGDAAHMMPPFQGQGMNSGVRDVANLSWKLKAVLGGVLGAELLDSYELERKPHAAEMIQLSRRVGQILMIRNPVRAWLRDMAFAFASRMPGIARYLASGAFKPSPRALAGYFLPSASGLAGRLFIQPDVVDLDGRRRPLDEHLGAGFVLLRVAEAEPKPFHAFHHPVWSRLGARRVVVLPGGLSDRPDGADVVVGDIAGRIGAWVGGRGGVTLLLRPDRYVAAVIPTGEEDRVADLLAALAPPAAGVVPAPSAQSPTPKAIVSLDA